MQRRQHCSAFQLPTYMNNLREHSTRIQHRCACYGPGIAVDRDRPVSKTSPCPKVVLSRRGAEKQQDLREGL